MSRQTQSGLRLAGHLLSVGPLARHRVVKKEPARCLNQISHTLTLSSNRSKVKNALVRCLAFACTLKDAKCAHNIACNRSQISLNYNFNGAFVCVFVSQCACRKVTVQAIKRLMNVLVLAGVIHAPIR